MNRVDFFIGGFVTRAHDAAIILDGESPLDELVKAAIGTISTDIEVTCGDVTMHLAAWQDPEHWSDEWAEAGIDSEDVGSYVASQMVVAP